MIFYNIDHIIFHYLSLCINLHLPIMHSMQIIQLMVILLLKRKGVGEKFFFLTFWNQIRMIRMI